MADTEIGTAWKRRMWGLLRYVEAGSYAPRGFGFVRHEVESNGRWVAPFGLNYVLRALWLIELKLCRTWPMPVRSKTEQGLMITTREAWERNESSKLYWDRVRAAGLICAAARGMCEKDRLIAMEAARAIEKGIA